MHNALINDIKSLIGEGMKNRHKLLKGKVMKSHCKPYQKIGIGLVLMSSCLLLINSPALAATEIQTLVASSQVSWVLPAGYSNAQGAVNGIPIDNENLSFDLLDESGGLHADGYYSYQISVSSEEMADDIAAMKVAREASDNEAYSRLANKLQEGSAYKTVSTSGAFEIINGQIEEYDLEAKDLANQQVRISSENQSEEEDND